MRHPSYAIRFRHNPRTRASTCSGQGACRNTHARENATCGMLEKQETWKRDGGFDRIETIAEMHEEILRRMHAGFDPEPFHTGLYNP